MYCDFYIRCLFPYVTPWASHITENKENAMDVLIAPKYVAFRNQSYINVGL
jgi:hypothetical protein